MNTISPSSGSATIGVHPRDRIVGSRNAAGGARVRARVAKSGTLTKQIAARLMATTRTQGIRVVLHARLCMEMPGIAWLVLITTSVSACSSRCAVSAGVSISIERWK